VTALADRYRGALLGLAVGDALGTTLEFSEPGSFVPIDDMLGGGPYDLRAGEWTDDTSMALCLAESLLEHGFDPSDQLTRYVRWWLEGHNSSTGACFDIGNTVHPALEDFVATGRTRRPLERYGAGNGSLMRLAPVPLAYASDPRRAIDLAGESSWTTHGAQAAADACRYAAALLLGALQGASKQELLTPLYTPVRDLWDERPLSPEIHLVAAGSFRESEPPAIRGGGYVVECLEAALWALDRSSSFREGCLLAVNLGDDAGTTGAVFGQLAGAIYGVGGIPTGWLELIAHRELIEGLADRLFERSGLAE
jgi:ADP-ribosylglycohydrolase